MEKEKGVSLIVLVITIIIILIMTGVALVNIIKDNPILQANEARFKHTISEYKSELSLWITNQYLVTKGNLDISNINASKDEGTYENLKIKDIITSMKQRDLEKFIIEEGTLKYIGNDENEMKWSEE